MRLVFDIETNGLDFSDGNFLEQVTDLWCIVAYDLDQDEWYVWDQEQNNGNLIEALEEADELIGHNIIQFDLPVLRKLFNLSTDASIKDTLVVSRALYPDRPGGHSLAAWGERLSESKGEPPSFEEYSPRMLEYCRQDVTTNTRLYRRLMQEISGHDWDRSLSLEHRIAEIIAEQEARGFWFNLEQAENLENDWNERISGYDDSILNSLRYSIQGKRLVNKPFKINGEPSVINRRAAEECGLELGCIGGPWQSISYSKPDLNSKQQQKEFLLELGWKPENTTPSGQPKLDDSILKVPDVGPIIHERNVLSHRLSQVQGLLKLVDQNSRVHGGANPCGTNTGRMRHSRIVNIPRATSPYGKEIRSLFGVPGGKCLVGYDAASLELRILAHYIGNPEYNDKVTSTDKQNDAHTLAAKAANSSDRDLGKTINYALIYGAGDHKLGSIIGGTKRDGAVLRARLYAEIPGLADLVTRVQRAARKGYLIGLDGRKLWIRQPHQALNTLIQGGGAVFMKHVTEVLDACWKNERTFKVIDMHDEAQWECHTDDVSKLSVEIQDAFSLASTKLELRCPQEAEVKQGLNWAETH